MQFFPHNLPLTNVATAVSASFTRTGSFIANFSAIAVTRVDTASIALNLTGSSGVAGTNYGPIVGPKGAQGNRGVTGPRGDSVYLLSSSWHDESKAGASCAGNPPAPANCWTVKLYAAYELFGEFTCDFSNTPGYNPTTYYTNQGASQAYVDANFGADFPLYVNETCTDPLAPILAPYVTFPATLGAHSENGQNTVYAVTSLSTSSIAGTCGTGF